MKFESRPEDYDCDTRPWREWRKAAVTIDLQQKKDLGDDWNKRLRRCEKLLCFCWMKTMSLSSRLSSHRCKGGINGMYWPPRVFCGQHRNHERWARATSQRNLVMSSSTLIINIVSYTSRLAVVEARRLFVATCLKFFLLGTPLPSPHM